MNEDHREGERALRPAGLEFWELAARKAWYFMRFHEVRLQGLFLLNENQVAIAKQGGIKAVLRALEGHENNAGVQRYGCLALGNLACNNAENQVESIISTAVSFAGIATIASDEIYLKVACNQFI